MATEIEATIFIYKPNYLSINLLPRSSKYTLSLPAVVTIYTFQFPAVNLVQAHAEIAPLPSQRELSLAFQRRQSRSVVSTLLINTEAATWQQQTRAVRVREIRKGMNHLEFTLQVITQVIKPMPWGGAPWTKSFFPFSRHGCWACVCSMSVTPHTLTHTWVSTPPRPGSILKQLLLQVFLLCTKS